MLYRMYNKWAAAHGMSVEVLDYQDGDEAGMKSASMMVKGANAYGLLKSENGVHRLVRVSPFDANARLGHHLGVVLLVQHHQHGLGVVVQALQFFKAIQLAFQVADFVKHLFAQLGVIVKAGAGHGMLQLLHTLAGSINGQSLFQILDSGTVIGQLHFQFVSGNHGLVLSYILKPVKDTVYTQILH